MLISAHHVMRGKKDHWCDQCRSVIHKGQRYIVAYGSADRADPPYRIRLHYPVPPFEHCVQEDVLWLADKTTERRLAALEKKDGA